MSKRRLLEYESKHQALLNRQDFARRLWTNAGVAFLLICASLGIGMCGYHFFEGLEWIDAFVNAAMILSGMGPLAQIHSFSGKLFAGFYALYSGLSLILIAGFLIAPVVHRIFHRFHLEDDDREAHDR